MLNVHGRSHRFCDGVSRRGFLRIGTLGLGAASLTLADMLRGQARAADTKTKKSAILVYLPGGPSHIDMYDLKPEAPVEFRGEFKPIATNVPGVHICEHMPLQAQMWDKLSVLRSVISVHEHSDSLITTGYSDVVNRVAQHPSMGAVISKLRTGANDLPPWFHLFHGEFGNKTGFLGAAHRPFTPDGPALRNLQLAEGMTPARMNDRKALLTGFDQVRRDIDATGAMSALDTFSTRALDMVASGSVRKALDLTREEPRARDRYKGCEQFLAARRLVEAGVGCVTMNFLGGVGWDTHKSNFKILKPQLPNLDRGIANLIQDLHARGMENDVVTMVCGEFGRAPKISMAEDGGRDHWGEVMSVLVAGGGLKMGQAIGTTSDRGEYPKDRPYRMSQVLATVYQALGIDPSQTLTNGSGRPVYILDDRDPVAELI